MMYFSLLFLITFGFCGFVFPFLIRVTRWVLSFVLSFEEIFTGGKLCSTSYTCIGEFVFAFLIILLALKYLSIRVSCFLISFSYGFFSFTGDRGVLFSISHISYSWVFFILYRIVYFHLLHTYLATCHTASLNNSRHLFPILAII